MPLHTAVEKGRIHFLKWIVGRRGKEVLHQRTNIGETVMDAAAIGGNVELMKWLLTQVPKLLAQEDKDGWIPMHSAVLAANIQKQSDYLLKKLPIFT